MTAPPDPPGGRHDELKVAAEAAAIRAAKRLVRWIWRTVLRQK